MSGILYHFSLFLTCKEVLTHNPATLICLVNHLLTYLTNPNPKFSRLCSRYVLFTNTVRWALSGIRLLNLRVIDSFVPFILCSRPMWFTPPTMRYVVFFSLVFVGVYPPYPSGFAFRWISPHPVHALREPTFFRS